jgi:uncharacterized protein YndB with AHSA1/START domain
LLGLYRRTLLWYQERHEHRRDKLVPLDRRTGASIHAATHALPRRLLVAIAFFTLSIPVFAEMPDAKDIAVSIDRNGNTFAVRVELEVEATPEEVFAVLTDYDHMARFVSNVLESRTVRRDGDRLAVEQKSRLAVGPVHFDFTNVREIDLVPFREIRSRVTQGDMQGSSFTTTIVARGARTRVDNRGTFLSDRWTPPIIGNMVLEAETRKQFQEFRTEILRRKAAPVPAR